MLFADYSTRLSMAAYKSRREERGSSGPIWLHLLLLVGLIVSGCKRGEAPNDVKKASAPSLASTSKIHFANVTADSGVCFSFTDGHEANHNTLLEWVGGGVAIVDFDGDQRPDLMFTGGGGFDGQEILGSPCGLFRNVGHFRYQDVSAAALGNQKPHFNHGCQAADYDNDGFVDLLVTGYGGLKLFHNQGDGTFVEVQRKAELDDESWSTGAAWGDFNGDGNLDLYVAHYLDWSFANHPRCAGPKPNQTDACAPKRFAPLPDVFYLSRGDGSFRNATQEANLRKDGKGLGVIAADFDQDTDLDIYVANDTTANFLYLNDGKGNFEEVGLESGVSGDQVGEVNGSMGVDVGDYNRDGLLDLWVANYVQEPFALYRNFGGGQFQHVSTSTGVNALNGLFVGFGTALVDIDQDADEDIIVANGHVLKYPPIASVKQLPLVLVNNDARRYERVEFPENSYFSTKHLGRGLAVGDLDSDGDLDLVISHLREPVALLRNETPSTSSWLRVRLIGLGSNRNAIGSQLTLRTSRGNQLRCISGGGSYLSQRELLVSWGIPRGVTVRGLSIVWPSGVKEEISSISLNATLTLHEPPLAPSGI